MKKYEGRTMEGMEGATEGEFLKALKFASDQTNY